MWLVTALPNAVGIPPPQVPQNTTPAYVEEYFSTTARALKEPML